MSNPFVMQIRLSPEERRRLEAVAAAEYLPLATWARAVLLVRADAVRCWCGDEPGLGELEEGSGKKMTHHDREGLTTALVVLEARCDGNEMAEQAFMRVRNALVR